ncbi:MAG TPA: tetratricopeptide repeat protein [Bryobacteraceae bacterium]|nr:tetratricopeptide repeat protein [Bryobacteraceae bacterium]
MWFDEIAQDRARREVVRASRHPWFLMCSLALALPGAAQQPPSNPATFRDESRTGQSPAPAKPPVAVTPEMRGDIFMAKKMYREAAEAYKQGPKDSAVLLNKTGIAYHQMLELNLAEKYYRLAIKIDPHYAEAINNLGTIYYARKSYRRAVNEYKRALRIHPKSASILSNLGTGYFARKDYKRASETWQQAVALDPEVFESRSTQGVLLQERSVEERAKFHYALAQTYAKAGQNDRALLYIRRALEEGYKERKKIAEDPAFAALKDLPEFKELLTSEPRVL